MKRFLVTSLIFFLLLFSSVANAAPQFEQFLGGDGQGDWTPITNVCSPTYNAGADRFDGCFGWNNASSYWAVVDNDYSGVTITRIRVSVEGNQTRIQGSNPTAFHRIYVGGNPIAALAVPGGLGVFTGTVDTGEIGITGDIVEIRAVVRANNGSDGGYIRITKIEVWYDDEGTGGIVGNWTRPIAEADEHPQWEMFDYIRVHDLDPDYELDNQIVFAFSEQFGANVFAAADGVVTAVEPWTTNDCQDITGGSSGVATAHLFGANCYVVVPVPINNDFQHYVFKVNPVGLYRVDIRVSVDTVLRYIVTNAPEYITVGDLVNQGCILGLTSQLLNVSQVAIDSISIAFSENGGVGFGTQIEWQTLITQAGVVTIAMGKVPPEGGTPIMGSLYPFLTQYAQFDEACNSDPAYASCLGDGTLARPNEWTATGNVAWLQPGAQIGPGSQIRVTMNLDPEQEYSLTVTVARTGPLPATMRLQIGASIETSTILSPPGEFRGYTIESQLHESDVGGFWTVAVINSGQEYLEIRSVCVTEGEPNYAPSSCYFNNWSFDFGGSGWTLSSGVIPGDGTIFVPDMDTFAQDYTLYPNDDSSTRNYELRVITRLWTTSFFDPADTSHHADTVQLEYDTGSGYQFMNEVVSSSAPVTFYQYSAYGGAIEWEAVLSVSAPESGTITIRPTITTTDTEVLGLSILSVCIEGPFPHPQEIIYGGPQEELPYNCQHIDPPAGNNIGPWISWHWAKLNKFFQCDLMVLLNRMYRMFVEFFRTITWTIRYWIALAKMSVDWLGDNFLPWLAGYLSNTAGGTTIVVNEGGQQCEWWNLLCHIVNALQLIADVIGQIITEIIGPVVDLVIWMIQRAFDLLITALTGLLVIGFQLIGQILGLLGIAQQLLASLADAYSNATPVTIDGLPMCTGAQTNDLWCAAMWTLENTVFAGLGALLIPLIVSIGAIHLIIWVIRQIKEAFMTAGAAI